jgi:hypothetical protein
VEVGRISSRGNRLRAAIGLAVALLCVWGGAPAAANAPPQPDLNGFETDTSGWFDTTGGTVTRQPTGYVPAGVDYAEGVTSAAGNFHGRVGLGTASTCPSSAGPQLTNPGPFTRWGGFNSTFPAGGYRTAIAVYLDVAYAVAHPDTRFDWASAINNSSGFFLRDFAFNVGTDASGFVISASNQETRCGVSPYDPTNGPISVPLSGWYVLRHSFRDVGGTLTVDMSVIRCEPVCPNADEAGGTTVGTWTLSNPADAISGVGGNRYGWFVSNEFDELPIDSGERTGITGAMSAADVALDEGDGAGNSAQLKVTLSAPAVGNEKIDFSTGDGTAGSPQDFSSSSGTATFEPGATEATVSVPIVGDTVDESDETFTVQLANPRNATLSDGEAAVTIRDDDNGTAKDPRCERLRKKLKRQRGNLERAQSDGKQSQLKSNIQKTKKRLKELAC